MAKSKDYWQKRFTAVESMMNDKSRTVVNQVTPAFDKASKQIQNEIDVWYARFAKNNQVSLAEARQMLTAKELKELRWDVEEYIKFGKQNALDGKWMQELENASAKVHISRLEALKIRTQQAAEVAFGNETDALDRLIANTYTEDYYHTAYEIQKGLGLGWDIGQIDTNKLDKLVKKPWTADKMTFSDRIWKSKTQLLDSLHTELTQMCILGKSPDQAINNIAHKLNVSKGQAGRLIMTESAYFSSQAQKDCFNELDVEMYEIVATLDSHTSEICQQMDGKVFKMSEFQAGVTAPPFHVWCRSTTVPYFDDEWGREGTRAARGEDGKTYQVPADMKYDDWKNSFVDGGSKDNIPQFVDPEELKKQIQSKQTEIDDLKKHIDDLRNQRISVINDRADFTSGQKWYSKYINMTDEEWDAYQQSIIDKEAELTKLMDDYQKQMDALFDEKGDGIVSDWESKYDELSELRRQARKQRSEVRDEINEFSAYNSYKSKFNGKTEKYYDDLIDDLKQQRVDVDKKVVSLQDEIKQLQDELKKAEDLKSQADYSAKSLAEIQTEITDKYDTILKTQKEKDQLNKIVSGMDKDRANLYNRLSVNAPNNNYYEKKTGWYSPYEYKVHMDLNNNHWAKNAGRPDDAAWKTKFHEEFHQLDHILGSQKSPFALVDGTADQYARVFTRTNTAAGKKMINAIDDDILNLINTACDWERTTQGTVVKNIKSLDRISSEAKSALISYLTDQCPTAKDRTLIDTVTDAIGLTTEGKIHPYNYEFWGHKLSYCKDRGKDGATSELWANIGGFLMRGDTEAIEAVRKMMPNTIDTYSEVFNEVVEYAKTHNLTY